MFNILSKGMNVAVFRSSEENPGIQRHASHLVKVLYKLRMMFDYQLYNNLNKFFMKFNNI